MIRFILSMAWAVSTVALMLTCFAEYVFDRDGSLKTLAIRLMLCLVWPFAALSPAGRRVLFNYVEGVQ